MDRGEKQGVYEHIVLEHAEDQSRAEVWRILPEILSEVPDRVLEGEHSIRIGYKRPDGFIYVLLRKSGKQILL